MKNPFKPHSELNSMTDTVGYGKLIFISIFALASLGIASCRLPKYSAVPPESPYVVTKTGKKIEATEVSMVANKKGSSQLMVDNTIYSPKTIARYSNGVATFANITDSQFAKKVVSGNLSLYTNNLDKKGRPASTKPLFYYVENGSSGVLSELNYGVLKSMIPPDASASKYLKRYRHFNHLSYSLGGIGLGIAGVGMFQIVNDKKGTPPLLVSGVLWPQP